jgi:hypothetical protein
VFSLGLALLMFTVAGLGAMHLVRVSKRRTEEEMGLAPELEETCGCRIDSTNCTWPFVRHSIYENFVIIKYIGGTYILPKEGLSVETSDGHFSSGIQYTSPKYPERELRVWTKNKDKILELIKNDA